MRRYDLAYRFIPTLISEFKKGNINQVQLLDENYFKKILQLEENEFNIDDLIIEHKILSKTKSVGIYIFPEPQKMPEPKFGLLFFDFITKTTKYYTLEKSNLVDHGKEKYMIGSTSESEIHLNHGNFEQEPILDNFLNHIYITYEKESKSKFVLYFISGLAICLLVYFMFK